MPINYGGPPTPTQQTSGLGVASLVLGIVGWNGAAKDKRIAKGLPVAGTILNGVALLCLIIFFVVIGIVFAFAGTAGAKINEAAKAEIAVASDRQEVYLDSRSAGDDMLTNAAAEEVDAATIAEARQAFQERLNLIRDPGQNLEKAKQKAKTALDELAADLADDSN